MHATSPQISAAYVFNNTWRRTIRHLVTIGALVIAVVMTIRMWDCRGPTTVAGKNVRPRPTGWLAPVVSSTESPSSSSVPGITAAMQRFSWDEFWKSSDSPALRAPLVADLIVRLTEFLVVEPKVPILPQCNSPPSLIDPATIDCAKYTSAFTGERRSQPVKIAHMIQFGFDVDVLEIHLRELYDVVDHFFILESTKAQLELVEKPLVWDRIRTQSRFLPFLDKVVHIIIDDVDAARTGSAKDIWYIEGLQEKTRFDKFLEWNSKQAVPFNDQDMIGFGDTDEVGSRENVQLLRHCVPKGPAVDIGIWFANGRLTNAFRPDYPVSGHPYSLGDPTYHTFAGAKALVAAGKVPSRNRGTSGPFLLGGMHMTRHRFLPYMVLESITCTECGWSGASFTSDIQRTMTSPDIRAMEIFWDKIHTIVPSRTVDISSLPESEREALVKVPWFLTCNPDRYPYWSGKHDDRLDP